VNEVGHYNRQLVTSAGRPIHSARAALQDYLAGSMNFNQSINQRL